MSETPAHPHPPCAHRHLHHAEATSAGRLLARRPLGGAALLTLFLALAFAAAINHGWLLLRVDRPLDEWVQRHHSAAASAFFDHATFFGWNPTVFIGGAILAALAALRCRRVAVLVVLATALRPLVEYLLKIAVDRTRPDVIPSIVQVGPSFPSGHVLASSVFVFSALMVAALYVDSLAVWRLLTALGAALLLSVGASRVYLGYHWPSDVVAGWLAGALLIAALDLGYRSLHKPPVTGVRSADDLVSAG